MNVKPWEAEQNDVLCRVSIAEFAASMGTLGIGCRMSSDSSARREKDQS